LVSVRNGPIPLQATGRAGGVHFRVARRCTAGLEPGGAGSSTPLWSIWRFSWAGAR